MQQLSEQAKRLIEDFEKKIEAIPVKERDAVLKRMTSHISALNEEVKGVIHILKMNSNHTNGVENLHSKRPENDIGHLTDFI